MAPHGSAAPAPQNESAWQARAAFFCDLCQKGYANMNEFLAHEASYEHNHNVRRKSLITQNARMARNAAHSSKSVTDSSKDMVALEPTKREAAPKGFKKGGFKSAFGKSDANTPVVLKADASSVQKQDSIGKHGDASMDLGESSGSAKALPKADGGAVAPGGHQSQIQQPVYSDSEEEDAYDPFKPTMCGCVHKEG